MDDPNVATEVRSNPEILERETQRASVTYPKGTVTRRDRPLSSFHRRPSAGSLGGLTRTKSWPLSARLFVSLLLCVAGFCYATLLGSIWIDTQMNIGLIAEGYGSMGRIELVEHSFKYMFWFFGIFGILGSVFLFTSYSEKLKRVFALVIPLLILFDIAFAWLIRFHDVFAWQLFAAGVLLAASFLATFLLIQIDLWFLKDK